MMLTQTELQYFKARVGEMLDEISRATDDAAANDMGTVMLDQACVGRLSRMDALHNRRWRQVGRKRCSAKIAVCSLPGHALAKEALASAAVVTSRFQKIGLKPIQAPRFARIVRRKWRRVGPVRGDDLSVGVVYAQQARAYNSDMAFLHMLF